MSADAFTDPGGPMTPTRAQLPAISSPSPLAIKPSLSYDIPRHKYKQISICFNETKDELERIKAEATTNALIIKELRAKVMELESIVHKQRATISTQSRIIAGPKELHLEHSSATPALSTTHPQLRNQDSFEAAYSTRIVSADMYDMHPAFPARISPPYPAHASHAYGTYGLTLPRRTPIYGVFPLPSPSTGPTMNFKETMQAFGTRLETLWTKSDGFGHRYASHPPLSKDSDLAPKVKSYIMAISHRNLASHLLENPTRRSYTVAKAINFFFVRDVLKITVVKGFDKAFDIDMVKIKKQLSCDNVVSVRHQMLVATANHVNMLKNRSGFAEFYQKRTREHADKLWSLVEPLVSKLITIEDKVAAENHLKELTAEAHALALDLYSTPYDIRFHFPEWNEHFDCRNMVTLRDPDVGSDSTIPKVKLGITPTTKIGNHYHAPAHVLVVHMARVLLRTSEFTNRDVRVDYDRKRDNRRWSLVGGSYKYGLEGGQSLDQPFSA